MIVQSVNPIGDAAMLINTLVLAAIAATTSAQSASSLTLSGTNTAGDLSGGDYATGTYRSYESTISLSTSDSYLTLTGASATGSQTSKPQNETITTNGTTITRTSATQTLLSASGSNSTSATGSSSSTAARPTNTQPCNGYPELCNRKYSNFTMVAAHNSPFSVQGNVASNQALDVTTQLNDGIRMLQFQTHKPNSTSPIRLCHTSCDLLDAGSLVDYLTTVRQWLDANPYEVVTILMGNDDVLDPGNYTDPVYNSGLIRYVYTPPKVPMALEDWPTLGEMIIRQKRAVVMLDYQADQTAIPWLLDEFAQFWETPFSPTDREFPCTVDRPPNQDRNISANRMIISNHNLNVDVNIASLGVSGLLIPATTLLNETNAVVGYGSAGVAASNCTADWNRPPNVLLVDYYNVGSFNGSVFQVAADANGVNYNRDSCCGLTQSQVSFGTSLKIDNLFVVAIAALLTFALL